MAQPTTFKTIAAKTGQGKHTQPRKTAKPINPAAIPGKGDALTFLTSDGETITFPDTGLPPGDASAIAGEEALHKIWNRPAEDVAWRDM